VKEYQDTIMAMVLFVLCVAWFFIGRAYQIITTVTDQEITESKYE